MKLVHFCTGFVFCTFPVEKYNQSPFIVLQRSNDYVYLCLLVNIKIKTFGWHIQKLGVVLKIFVASMDCSVGIVATINICQVPRMLLIHCSSIIQWMR